MLTVPLAAHLLLPLQLLINGKFVDAKSGKTFEDLDPRTGRRG
jgi:hypothetical protein